MDERQQSGKSGVRSDSQKHATANRGGEHTVPPAMPVEGARTIRVQPIDSNRYPSVGILDFRLDKTVEFGKFGKVLDGIQKNLHHAATKIDEARKGTRKIERKLTQVEELPAAEASGLLDGIGLVEEEPDTVSAA